MTSQFCWSCLSKLRPSPRPLLPSAITVPSSALRAPFSSTAAQHVAPPKKSRTQDTGPKFRVSRSARAPPNQRPAKPPRYTPEELKASKTELALSNPNAIDVPGLEPLSMENVVDPASRGKVFAVPPPLLQQLRALAVFRPNQNWGLFKGPSTLVREETLELGALVKGIGAEEGEMSGKTVAQIVTGARNTGKSTHLLQALTLGLMNEWVAISVPNTHALTSGATAYAPISNTNPVQYSQKNATAELLTNIADANRPVLSKLHISQNHGALGNAIAADSNLHALAVFGAARADYSWQVFQALWKELTAQSPASDVEGIKPFEARPPMVVAVDGLAHWMVDTAYLNAEYKPIHAQDLTLVKHFLSLATNPSALPNGGVALFATTTCNSPLSSSLDISIKQLAAREAGIEPTSADFPLPTPYDKLDARAMSYFNAVNDNDAVGMGVRTLKGINKDDTRGLLEFYAQSGLMREQISEEVVGEKWTLAGGGVIGELQKFGKRIRASN